jgi:two-component sensor histidine kinase
VSPPYKRAIRALARARDVRYRPPELVVDLEADNAMLRQALALSEGEGARRELVTQELTHRIGNLLAVVQAIATQTFKTASPASRQTFATRMFALAAAQRHLIDSETHDAPLASVVSEAIVAHCAEGDRCRMSGPPLTLNGRRAHALTLALHELATNAAKYGALSVDHGWIDVSWTVENDQLTFLWREHGGPAVSVPSRHGFGSLLITRNLGMAFSGVVDLGFAPSGVVCRLTAPAHAHAPAFADANALMK